MKCHLKYLAMIVLLLLFSVSGCGTDKAPSAATTEVIKYVCADGIIVSDSSLCLKPECPKLDCSTCPIRIETKTVEERIYVCSDLTEVKHKEDCLKADSEGWYEVTTLHGKGQGTTKKFHIRGNEWRYSVKCDLSTAGYNIVVYDGNSKHITMNLMVPCSNQFDEYSYVYQGDDDFYFDIYGTNWEIKVEARK